jgi:hypothetical protein
LCGRHHRYVHALALQGRVTSSGGTSRVEWDHRPTSWTATTATAATATAMGMASRPGGAGDTRPPLTDPLLDQLIRRWLRRHPDLGTAAA